MSYRRRVNVVKVLDEWKPGIYEERICPGHTRLVEIRKAVPFEQEVRFRVFAFPISYDLGWVSTSGRLRMYRPLTEMEVIAWMAKRES